MAVYAIGDVQGCYDPLQRLLEKLRFDASQDQVWFTGDLINRGPHSLKVVRLVRSLGERAITVLGNHDLTLLAVAEGHVALRRKDTFHDLLHAADRETLLEWMRHRALMHYDPDLNFILVHAGLAPSWDLRQAQTLAAEVQAVLQSPHYNDFLAQMYNDEPRRWCDDLKGIPRLRCIVNYFTRMRYCHGDGALDYVHKGPLGTQAAHLIPWFQLPARRHTGLNIVFGHWAALGLYQDKGIYGLDSGCSWGARLTAMRLDAPEETYWVNCSE